VGKAATGLIVLQYRRVGEGRVGLRLPGGAVIPLAATALVLALMTTLAWREIAAVLVALAFAAITYVVPTRRRIAEETPSDGPSIRQV